MTSRQHTKGKNGKDDEVNALARHYMFVSLHKMHLQITGQLSPELSAALDAHLSLMCREIRCIEGRSAQVADGQYDQHPTTVKAKPLPGHSKTIESKSLRPKQAADLLGIGRTTLWKLASTRPDFPRPIRLTPRVTVYDRNSLLAWRNKQGAA